MPVIEHRNILFCLFDSLSLKDFDQLECAGALPALSCLRSDGVFFNRCYTPCPESSPARASVFTGLDPAVHGLWTNGVALPHTETTFSQLLKSAGYSTFLAGRYQLAGVSRWTTEHVPVRDFEQMAWAHGPLHRSRQNAYLNWLKQIAPEDYSSIFTTQANPDKTQLSHQQKTAYEALPDELSFNHWVGKSASNWINKSIDDKPLLAIAGFCVGNDLGAEPHPDGDGEGVSEIALRQADTAIGKIVEHLRASSRSKDTVIVIASARGNCDFASGDNQMNERSIRVPLLFSYPGCDPRVVDSLVSTIDIAPTVMELANVVRGGRTQGCLLPAVCNDTEATRDWAMTRLRTSTLCGARNWKTSFCLNKWKLVTQHNASADGGDKLRLYDLESDPEEQSNLALDQTYAGTLESMIDQMIDARCALEDRTEPRIAEF